MYQNSVFRIFYIFLSVLTSFLVFWFIFPLLLGAAGIFFIILVVAFIIIMIINTFFPNLGPNVNVRVVKIQRMDSSQKDDDVIETTIEHKEQNHE